MQYKNRLKKLFFVFTFAASTGNDNRHNRKQKCYFCALGLWVTCAHLHI